MHLSQFCFASFAREKITSTLFLLNTAYFVWVFRFPFLVTLDLLEKTRIEVSSINKVTASFRLISNRLRHILFLILETTPLDFTSKSFLMNKLENKAIKLPWTTSVVFRTVERAGNLLKLVFGNSSSLLKVS